MNGSAAIPIVVTIPATPDLVRVLRAVAASAAVRSQLTIDAIEDLRIAVDEASAQLLTASRDPSSLTMSILADRHGVEVALSADGEADPWPPAGLDRSLAWQVLSGLSDEVAFERRDVGPAVVIRKRGVVPAERP